MKDLILEAWIAGLFEGEGTFVISNGISKGISITSTDLDILERVKNYCKGTIYTRPRINPKWKTAYVWIVRGEEAIEFLNMIKPFLLSRRLKRSEDWINSLPKGRINKNENIIKTLFNKGLTHKEIADRLGLDRSTISHFVRSRKLKRIINGA